MAVFRGGEGCALAAAGVQGVGTSSPPRVVASGTTIFSITEVENLLSDRMLVAPPGGRWKL